MSAQRDRSTDGPAGRPYTPAPARTYKLILFDLGRVLVDFDIDQIAYRLMARARKRYADILAYYRDSNLFYDFENGKLTPEQVVKNINEKLGTRLTLEEFTPLWCDIFFEIAEMCEVVEKLDGRYKLILVSDTNVLHYEFIKAHFPILAKFDAHILSFRVGARKPSPVIFNAALNQAGVKAEETIFIDDKMENAEGASKLGITGIQHRSPPETKKELERLGIRA